jgi:putative transposase
MRKSRLGKSLIIGITWEHVAGAKVADLCRRHGIGAPALSIWNAKQCGLALSEARRLNAQEEEDRRFKEPLDNAP